MCIIIFIIIHFQFLAQKNTFYLELICNSKQFYRLQLQSSNYFLCYQSVSCIFLIRKLSVIVISKSFVDDSGKMNCFGLALVVIKFTYLGETENLNFKYVLFRFVKSYLHYFLYFIHNLCHVNINNVGKTKTIK